MMRRSLFPLSHYQERFFQSSALLSSQAKTLIQSRQFDPQDAHSFHNHPSFPNHLDPLRYLNSVSAIVRALAQNPRNYNALTALDSLLTQTQLLDSATALVVIDCLSQIRKLGRAKTVLSYLKSKGRVSDYFLYSLVLDYLAKDGTIDDVETLWHDICESESPSIRRICISDYVIYISKFGGVDEIKGVCEKLLMSGRALKRHSYIALMGALCKVNEGMLTKKVAREMYVRGFKVDDWSYYFMFQCFCKNGDLGGADFMLRRLIKRKFYFDICIYGAFLHALCRLSKFKEAKKLFRKLIRKDCHGGTEKVEVLKEGRRAIFQLTCGGAVPEVMAYEAYFRALCNVGRLDEAELLLKEMLKKRAVPEVCVYGSFIKALFRAGRDEDAMKFFSVQKKKGIVRANEIGRYVIVGLCEKGKVDEAFGVFNETLKNGAFVDAVSACNSMLDCYWKQGRVAEAESLFKMLMDVTCAPLAASTCKIMVTRYINQGDVLKALHIFEEMPKNKMVADGSLYEVIIRGLCACGRLKEGFKYLNCMIESGQLITSKRWKDIFPEHYFICR